MNSTDACCCIFSRFARFRLVFSLARCSASPVPVPSSVFCPRCPQVVFPWSVVFLSGVSPSVVSFSVVVASPQVLPRVLPFSVLVSFVPSSPFPAALFPALVH